MNSKISSYVKKIVIIMTVVVLCASNVTYAFSFGRKNPTSTKKPTTQTSKKGFGSFGGFGISTDNKTTTSNPFGNMNFGSLSNLGNMNFGSLGNLGNLGNFGLDALGNLGNLDLGILGDLGNLDLGALGDLANLDLGALGNLGDLDLGFLGNLGNLDLGALGDIASVDLGALGKVVSGLIGSISGTLEADVTKTITMDAKTSVEFGADKANLSATVYMHKNPTNKWVLLVHPFLLDGKIIAGSVGPFYYEKGYNVIAPDLRGFGNSEGSVALGCLESMDIYDWLVKLNADYDVDQVIVHGISLGGATTNYLSGINEFMKNGPTKIKSTLKPLRELNVIGLVEDCGYVDMTEFASKSIVKSYSGLTDANFDYYSKATNSLQYCDVPMLVIHGTSDTTVKPKNADTVADTVNNNPYNGTAEVWKVSGASHAFIVMGSNTDAYRTHVHNFIAKVEK